MRAALAGLLTLLAVGMLWVLDGEGLLTVAIEDRGLWPALLLASLVYAVLMALPFVPGVELGWLIIGLFGLPGILAAWASTVLGLCMGYGCGRQLNGREWLGRLQARRAALLANAPADMPRGARLLRRCLLWHDRHPYLFVLVALNIPGNWIIGGGGGIAWFSGALAHVRFLPFAATVTMATGVVPLVLLAGFAVRS